MTVGSWRVRTRLAAAVTVAVSGMAGVTGCSAQSGAAAVVEGEAIPVADVHAATHELAPYLQNASPSAVLLLLIAEPAFERVAAENGIGVSDQEARAVLEQLAAPPEAGEEGEGGDAAEAPAQAPEFGPASLSVARLTLLQRRLGEHPDGQALLEEVTTDLAELDVEVNPRYGEVDFEQGGITPVAHDWLVPATATP